ncbi:hypothetical protein EPN28_02530 [Patescibacteria group bacterium]|nr:MAG: hypothetical protein EPN28_02530 [Patescibacteria group bacterium]
MECPFCDHKILTKEKITENNHFYLAPAKGSFLPYYFLIISHAHQRAIGSFLNEPKVYNQFIEIKTETEKFIKKKNYRNYICFEHGASYDDKGGCCVEHAHFHILPFNIPLRKKIESHLGKATVLKNYKELGFQVKDNPSYLLLEENKKIYFWKQPLIISQYMRRLIANELLIKEKFDWKRFPFWSLMKKSIKEWQSHHRRQK